MAKKSNLKISKECIEKFKERYVVELQNPDFGNARTIRNILDEAITNHALRISRDRSAKENLLTAADIDGSSHQTI